MATEAAWLNGNRTMETKKKSCALTSTGLLMEGLSSDSLAKAPPKLEYCLGFRVRRYYLKIYRITRCVGLS